MFPVTAEVAGSGSVVPLFQYRCPSRLTGVEGYESLQGTQSVGEIKKLNCGGFCAVTMSKSVAKGIIKSQRRKSEIALSYTSVATYRNT